MSDERKVTNSQDIPNSWEDTCPECGGKCVSACRCLENHRHCANGHTWHWVGVREHFQVEGDYRWHSRVIYYHPVISGGH